MTILGALIDLQCRAVVANVRVDFVLPESVYRRLLAEESARFMPGGHAWNGSILDETIPPHIDLYGPGGPFRIIRGPA